MKIITLFLLFLGSPMTHAQDAHAQPKQGKCTSTPCGNTASGEDPQEQRIREGAARSAAIRAGGDDQERWSSIRLNSDSIKPERLRVTVVASTGLEMRLDPKLGHVIFSGPGMRHSFAIASPQGDKTSVCPDYALKIVEGSAAHALVRLTCLQREIAPGRYHMSVDYYLYDVETGVMRNIWAAAVRDKNAHLPDAKPTPSLKSIPNGYLFDWSGIQPSNGKNSITTLHNSFVRTTANGEKALICTDLSAPKGQGVEAEMCEGGILPRVTGK